MDLETAVRIVFDEAKRRGQNRVAAALSVSNGTLSKWKKGVRPEGNVMRRVLEFAEGVAAPAATQSPDVLAAAIERTGENLVRLAEIRGYAMSVLAMLRAVTDEQARVVESLEPWARAEGQALAANVPPQDHEAIRESFRQSAEQTAPSRRKGAR